MTIQEQIKQDLKEAMLNKDTELRDYLRVVVAEFSRIKVDGGSKDHADNIISKKLSELRENAKIMENEYELKVLRTYIPDKLSEDETRVIVTNIINANNISSIKEMGKFMGALKLYPGAALIDNAIASTIFKELIS